jgi:hypothetical protein
LKRLNLPLLGSVDGSGRDRLGGSRRRHRMVGLWTCCEGRRINADMNLKVHDQTFGISRSDKPTRFRDGGGPRTASHLVRAEVSVVSKLDDLIWSLRA